MNESDDFKARLTHHGDQSRAALDEVSILLGHYYRRLLENDFSEAQAYGLVVQIQAQLMQARKTD